MHLVGVSVWLPWFFIKVAGTQPIWVVGLGMIFNSTLASSGRECVFRNFGDPMSKIARGEVFTSLDVSGFLEISVDVPMETLGFTGSSSSLKAKSFLSMVSQSVAPVNKSVVALIECLLVEGVFCVCAVDGLKEILLLDCFTING